ncbi:MAG: histidine phosphatase family protein [Clostridia bacterium]|nr:histidine phosphatase family protein [Clostridia bacterium]
MILYIIRHGDPDYANDTLTEYGWRQAEALGERMAKEKLDLIYTSPMGRAIATAEPTCRKTGIQSSIEPWMAEHIDYMRSPDFKNDVEYNFSFKKGVTEYKDYYQGERGEFIQKMIDSSDEFLARHGYVREGGIYRIAEPSNKRIACFCHGGFGAAWISHLLGLPATFGWFKITMYTTCVTKLSFYDFDKTGYAQVTAEYIADVSHNVYGGVKP